MQPIDTPVNAFDRFLAQLADKRMFIVARNGNRARGGDGIKAPIDPATGNPNDAQDPATWMLPHEARAFAMLDSDWIIGIVLTPGCGLACLDQDHVRNDDGSWDSSRVDWLAQWFPLAYRETSQSGHGKHTIFRVEGAIHEHGTRNREAHLEAYHERRYIALTGQDAEGDLVDYTYNFNALLKEYFPPTGTNNAIEWSDEPTHPDYTATLTDDELIAIARASQPLKAFTGEPRFEDLWTANADVLSKRWPDPGSGSYDESATDLALAGQIAFYTGCNHGRIYRLMLESALRRAKWDREDYIRRTIAKAVSSALTRATYAPVRDAVPPAPTTAPVAASPGAMGSWIHINQQPAVFKNCIYIEDLCGIYAPNASEPLDKKRFDIRYPGVYVTTIEGKGTDSAWECFTRTTLWSPPKVRSSYFDPRDPYLHIKDGSVNVCNRPTVRMIAGDPTPYLNHLRKMLPNGRDAEILNAFFAACVQYPGIKATWCPVLQGAPGTGKSLLASIMRYALGPSMVVTVRSNQLTNRFNGWLCNNMLLVFDEIKLDHDRSDAWETLKPIVTEPLHQIEYKGMDPVQRTICNNILICTNHKDALPKTSAERRLCMLYGAQQEPADLARDGMDTKYFDAFRAWLNADGPDGRPGTGYAIVAHYLSVCAIPPEFDFTKGADRAPMTTTTTDALIASRPGAEQEIAEAIEAGELGFRNGLMLGSTIPIRVRHAGLRINHNRIAALAAALDYMPHPDAGSRGRIVIERTQHVLYARRDHPSIGKGFSALDLTRIYQESQK